MRKILALGLGIVLLAAACNKATTENGSNNNSNNNSNSTGSNQAQSGTVEIAITSSGFSPVDVTVKKGSTVVFKNNGSTQAWPASDPHPTHTDLQGFDPKRGLAQGESYSFSFSGTGKWKFHDHLNPGRRGSVTVVE